MGSSGISVKFESQYVLLSLLHHLWKVQTQVIYLAAAFSILRREMIRHIEKNASHIQICTNFAGLPLTSEEAQAKLDRCPTFRKATDKFSLMSNNSQSLVKTAIALDYGIRLRSCLESNTPHPAVASRPWR